MRVNIFKDYEFISGGEGGQVSLSHKDCNTNILEPVETMKDAFQAVTNHANNECRLRKEK